MVPPVPVSEKELDAASAAAEEAFEDCLTDDEGNFVSELDPARLAVLADALEEAGADAELLAHLRSAGPHVRGCSALDAILSKE